LAHRLPLSPPFLPVESKDGEIHRRRQPPAAFFNLLIGAGLSPHGDMVSSLQRQKRRFERGTAMHFDLTLLARILLTVVTLAYGFATVLADFNKTHATNPKWTPHARFHVVWQISSYVGFGVLALALTWWPGPLAIERLYLVAAMGTVVYVAFFVAVFAMPVYGGEAYDQNGYVPFAAPVPLIAKKWDVNITIFSVMVCVLIAAALSINGAAAG
jgi:hypothetical protein